MTTFEGPAGVATFRAIAIKHALKLYARTGMKANSAYTPKNMMAAASDITGKRFKPRDYQGAIDALAEWIEANGTNGRTESPIPSTRQREADIVDSRKKESR